MERKKLLVIRFSAMGDVAMASAVVKAALDFGQKPEIDLLSKPFFEPLFEKQSGFLFIKPDLKGKHRGITGLYRLYRRLRKNNYSAVIDLHGSLRSRVLSFFFRMGGTPVFTIDKGRAEKRELLKRGAQKTQGLKHSTGRYAEVFEKVGIKPELKRDSLPILGRNTDRVEALLAKKNDQKWIGIAPFAAHKSKEWKGDRIIQLSEEIRKEGSRILWFGGGQRELDIIENQLIKQGTDILVAGQFKLDEELALMRHIDAMICMDSANMHMAALSGIPVVSIWGPTHPKAGFSPLFNEGGVVQAEMECRPCTIYGKLKSRADKICAEKSMEAVTVEMVLHKLWECLD